MNLEEKALKMHSYGRDRAESLNIEFGYLCGYQDSIKDLEQLATANPKMSASDLVKELKKLL